MNQELITLYQKTIGCTIDELASEVLLLATTVSRDPKIYYRIKDSDVLEKKMTLKGVVSVFNIDDVYGLRILVSSVEESYAVTDVIIGAFVSFLDHDFIARPKTRPDKPHLVGKSLRLLQIVAYKNGVSFEVQVTTFEFNDENQSLHDEYHREKYHRAGSS